MPEPQNRTPAGANPPVDADTTARADLASTGAAQASELFATQPTRAAEALAEIASHLQSGDIHLARRGLSAARRFLGPADLPHAGELARQIDLRERLLKPTAAFERAVEQRDWVAARRFARQASALAPGDEAPAWRALAAQCDDQVRAQWRIESFDVDLPADALVDCAEVVDTVPTSPLRLLADDGATLVLVSTYEHWVFLREIAVDERRVRRIGWLRAPESLEAFGPVQVDGDTIYLVAAGGAFLQLSRKPLDVEQYRSLRPFMLPDRVVNDAFVLPGGRFLWGELMEPDEEQLLSVIDLQEWRVARRPRGSWFEVVPGAAPARILATSLREDGDHDRTRLFDETGTPVGLRKPAGSRVKSLVAHPDGVGWVALVATGEETEDFASPVGVVELRPDRDPPAPLLVDGADEGAQTVLAVSLEQRLAFLLTGAAGKRRLIAYQSAPGGLEVLWQLELPNRSCLVQDPGAQRVLALAAVESGLRWARLTRSPPDLDAQAAEVDLLYRWPGSWECDIPRSRDLESALERALRDTTRDGAVERWVETNRRERRGDPAALAKLVLALVDFGRTDAARSVLEYASTRFPGNTQLAFARAEVESARANWPAVEQALSSVEGSALGSSERCHLHHLRGLSRLHANDAAGAQREFLEGQRADPEACGLAWYLDLARALLASVDQADESGDPVLGQIVRACRRADACLARGDAPGARAALDQTVVHAQLEMQSAARLAEAWLAITPDGASGQFGKALALARFASAQLDRSSLLRDELPGLGWGPERITGVAQRARAWLEQFARRAAPELQAQTPGARSAAPATAPSHPPEASHAPPATSQGAAPAHSLPPLGHEALRALVPGLDAAVRETVRYVRALPGWDERQTLGDDLGDLAPVREFMEEHREHILEAGAGPAAVREQSKLLGRHLDYCINFDLHRRKLFFADASLAWMLAQTSLDIEGRALRLPFACFGVAFTDRATLRCAERALRETGETLRDTPLAVLTVYVKRRPAPEGRSSLSLSFVFDARDGHVPRLRSCALDFDDDADLDGILDGRPAVPAGGAAVGPAAPAPVRGALRELVHLVLNAILYSTSADVAWPLSQSRVRQALGESRKRGKAKQARAANRVEELRERYSEEDVFYLPGRIPISQLRALQQAEREPKGGELMARFMVRGHWRRAARGWRDQRLRWIEPYWKGPELAAIIEKEYTLKI